MSPPHVATNKKTTDLRKTNNAGHGCGLRVADYFKSGSSCPKAVSTMHRKNHHPLDKNYELPLNIGLGFIFHYIYEKTSDQASTEAHNTTWADKS